MFAPHRGNDIVHHLGRQFTVQVLVVHGEHRRQGAAPHAADGLERHGTVSSGLTFLDAELVLHLGQDGLAAAYMARGPCADLDDLIAAGFEVKMLVKGGNTIGLGQGKLELPGDHCHGVLGKIAELLLGPLEHGDQYPALALHVVQNFVD